MTSSLLVVIDPPRKKFTPASITSAVMRRIKRARFDLVDVEVRWTPEPYVWADRRAVLLVGKDALRKHTDTTDITDETGGVFDLGGGVVGVACIHPETVMSTKLESGNLLLDVAIDRACRAAQGTVKPVGEPDWVYGNAAILEAALHNATRVAIDTEYNVETKRPFLIGVRTDANDEVVIVRPTEDIIELLQYHLNRRNLLKIFHHAPADLTSLHEIGIDVAPPLYDTLLAHSTMYSDLPLGLAHLALFWLDGWRNWKGMGHDDPAYLARDVLATDLLYDRTEKGLREASLLDVYHNEVIPSMGYALAIERRGMGVDTGAMEAANTGIIEQQGELLKEIDEFVTPYFEGRVQGVTAQADGMVLPTAPNPGGCDQHPTYTGARRKRFSANPNCHCERVYNEPGVVAYRGKMVEFNKQKGTLTTQGKRWACGFNASNNEHLRWLLYDKAALGLPTQRNQDNRPTANADAIAKLLGMAKVQANEAACRVLRAIKEYQHLDKMRSTFLNPPLDEAGNAHPEMRIFGTGTGRVAGGADPALLDKRGGSDSTYSAMNIPEEARHIYRSRFA